MLAQASMVPKEFQNNIGNCMIALNYANRVKADVFMLMQNIYVIHGKPGLEGKFIIALINQSNKYAGPVGFQWLNDSDKAVEASAVINSTADGYGCRAHAVDARSSETVIGPKITWSIVKKEGWYDKSGSKWQTMPELMFMYRSASWFANVHCPEIKLGMHTIEELEDVLDFAKMPDGSYQVDKATPDRSGDFDKAMGEDLAKDPLFQQFISITADSNEISVAEVKTQALGNVFQFKNVYHQWKAGQEKPSDVPGQFGSILIFDGDRPASENQEPEPEPKKGKLKDRLDENQLAFWEEWRLLRATGFEKYVSDVENLDLFRICHPDLRAEGRRKYREVVGKEWPLDIEKNIAPDPEPEPENSEGGDKGEGESVQPGGPEAVEKPDSEPVRDDEYVFRTFLALKLKYPVEYKEIVGDTKPNTVKDMNAVIDALEARVQEGVPGA
jgi:hypothetical protein